MNHWASTYLNIPYANHGRDRTGLDCYGLVRLIYRERLSIELPELSERYESALHDKEAIKALIREAQESDQWVDANGAPREFDVVTLRYGLAPSHVGVMLNAVEFLHILDGCWVTIGRIDRQPWCRKIVGVYRHVRLA